MKPEIVRTHSFVAEVTRFIKDSASEAIDVRGSFRIALSGGNTPRPIYQALALEDCDWRKWVVTFGDERCVAPDDNQSNYRMASESFLLVTSPGEVLRMKGELEPEEAAEEYDTAIQHLGKRFGEQRYRHDLILLGLGEDGHTASLFPGTTALEEAQRNIVPNFVPKFNAYRLTFTFPLINAARCVAFVINDKTKQPVIDRVLAGNSGLPSERVKPVDGELLWFLGHGK
ncbi:MAG: 6-phosphogluconolactonase [Verrucomicrobia bacterium]|nr:6-phosphogluconolactonase [Verrucomicrobiota bacterium]